MYGALVAIGKKTISILLKLWVGWGLRIDHWVQQSGGEGVLDKSSSSGTVEIKDLTQTEMG